MIVIKVASICVIDKADPSDPHKRECYWMRTFKTISPLDSTPKKHTEMYIPLRALRQSNQIVILLKVVKSECSIVSLLLRFYFLGLYVTFNVRGIDWIRN